MYFKGEKLFLVAEQAYSQSMGYVFTSVGGKNVVIDGGTAAEADVLENYLLRCGGKADAWFITHAHSDHLSAAAEILRRGKISVDKICFSFPSVEWLQEKEPAEISYIQAFFNAVEEKNISVAPLSKGKEFIFDSLKIIALNDSETDYESPTINNSTVALDVKTSSSSVLFLGDMEEEAGQRLISAYPNLKRDIVQMAHHGNRGVGREVYRHICPKMCLWNTPVWLWNNDPGAGYNSGNWTTLETRRWMEELGVKDHIVSKDGCRIIE